MHHERLRRALNLADITIGNYVALYKGSQERSFEEKIWGLSGVLVGYNVQQLNDVKGSGSVYSIYSKDLDLEVHIEREEEEIAKEYRKVVLGGHPGDVALAITATYRRSQHEVFKSCIKIIAKAMDLKIVCPLVMIQKKIREFKVVSPS